MESTHKPKPHYLPLDSIRGIAALSVVIHHLVLMPTFLAAFPQRPWIDWPFFRNAWLFVDLFFVLSGIVMTLSYAQPQSGDFSLREFLQRRFARLYPLHVVMLFVMLLFRFLRLGLVGAGLVVAVPAAFEVNNAYSFVLNLFMLHSLGFIDYLSWNGPSWSISVEFYTYIAFGLVMLLSVRVGATWVLGSAAAALVLAALMLLIIVLGKRSLELQWDFGLIRCVVGFFLGVLTAQLCLRIHRSDRRGLYGMLQILACVASVVLVSSVGAWPQLSFAAPFVFALLLGSLLAYPGAGPLPQLLGWSPLVWLGRRSYSVYMVHAFVILLAEYFVRAVGPRPIAALDAVCNGLAASLMLAIDVLAVLILSHLTYTFVELPGGKLMNRWLQGSFRFNKTRAVPSTRLQS
ncbi:acetyltransferase [Bradyrhizobium sacchari]|uniref:Peptidoglycan/LPS O-acetylase OafA/YrhL n=1 Tax=Bradyrhizobium sacchari TaxID=1399419 RepID=A0A560JAV3_9BRAD|nr:acyltransferase [Bradyrhizobium sacchari]OPY94032.1 acetyltransferase [Bradyrhizobium sacchari]TWB49287.1 peptidoglycan/LPS O-acetylase OafA/YrhL [Bradyrhizobium sacchari]TWB68117.1 peptidoglycan/LPS O-acetylase OafA/YrhL [Bradyrhizobium sacchari]